MPTPDARMAKLRLAAAPLAAALFAASLFGFAALRSDGYRHATKAVSELGAIGAPQAWAFNLFGYLLPGLLIAWFAGAFRPAVRNGGSRLGPALLALSGLAMAMAGVFPMDMAQRQASTSILHTIGAMSSGLFWAASLLWLSRLLSRVPAWRGWGRACPWFLLFPLANLAWQVSFRATGWPLPGWGQRLAFGGYFLWLVLSAWVLWRARSCNYSNSGNSGQGSVRKVAR